MEEIVTNRIEGLPEMFRALLNTAMQVERTKYLQAEEYQRSEERNGHANGYKLKTVKTRIGEITFDIPQVREGGFYLSAHEKGLRSERALTMTLAEMYVQGVSTKRGIAVTEQLCGTEISAMQVSRATAQLDAVLQEWREHSLGENRYLFLDVRYEKMRGAGHIRNAVVLVASGIRGKYSVSLSEQEAHWKDFLHSLKERGLTGVPLIISDDHVGLEVARRAEFGSVLWRGDFLELLK